MIIRKVERTDAVRWSKMRNQLWPGDPAIHDNELQQFFDGCSIDITETFVLDIEHEGVVGFIELNIRNFAEGSRNSRVPYIEAWYIAKPYRQQGYGKALINAAETWAKQQGFVELASDTEIDNLASIDVHKKLGFQETERVVCFLKKL